MMVRHLGQVPYAPTWQAMRSFTQARTPSTPDELWCCEHPPVYTLGLAANPGHVLNANGISLVQTDRGGEVTYHGPGQAVVYPLLCLQRYGLKVREYVALLEQVVIDTLSGLGVAAQRHAGSPGVYVQQAGGLAKVAALGIKLHKGCSYHGLALNVAMNLTPYAGINPCGYTQFAVVDLGHLGVKISVCEVQALLVAVLQERLLARLHLL